MSTMNPNNLQEDGLRFSLKKNDDIRKFVCGLICQFYVILLKFHIIVTLIREIVN
jgi:hypothetical protein